LLLPLLICHYYCHFAFIDDDAISPIFRSLLFSRIAIIFITLSLFSSTLMPLSLFFDDIDIFRFHYWYDFTYYYYFAIFSFIISSSISAITPYFIIIDIFIFDTLPQIFMSCHWCSLLTLIFSFTPRFRHCCFSCLVFIGFSPPFRFRLLYFRHITPLAATPFRCRHYFQLIIELLRHYFRLIFISLATIFATLPPLLFSPCHYLAGWYCHYCHAFASLIFSLFHSLICHWIFLLLRLL